MKHVALTLAAAAVLILLPSPSQAQSLPSNAPAWIEAEYDETQQTVWLTWAAVDDAASYNVYRNEALLATIFAPNYLDADVPLDAATYRVTATSDDGAESAPATAVIAYSSATGETALLVGSAPYFSGRLLWVNWCVPIGIGGAFPYVSIQTSCLEDLPP